MKLNSIISILLGATLALSTTSCADEELPSDIILSYEQGGDEPMPEPDPEPDPEPEPNPEPEPDPNDKIITVNGVTFKMKLVEAGTFTMGATEGQTGPGSRDLPTHQVTLTKDYYIGETEVTQALWYAVMGQKPTSDGEQWTEDKGQGDNYPAYCISWKDCQEFITKLNQLTGLTFRLPTEAEWEYAARGGHKKPIQTLYSGSNTIGDVAWYGANSSLKTHLVSSKAANALGLYDMSGNVDEWCYDWYDDYTSVAQTDPTGPASGSDRVFRGGSWGGTYRYCYVTSRMSVDEDFRSNDIGIRLALSAHGDGTETNPFNAVEAKAYTMSLNKNEESPNDVYIKGKVVSIKENFTTTYGNAAFYIADDMNASSENQFYVFRCLYLGNVKYTSGEILKEGDEVVVCGRVTNYMGNTPETVQNKAWLVSLNGKTADGGSTGVGEISGSEATGDGESGGDEISRNSITLDLSTLGFENATAVTDINMSDGTVLTFGNGTNTTNAPKYYTATGGVRMYANNTLNVKASGKTITGVKLTCDSYNGVDYVGNDTLNCKSGSTTVNPSVSGSTVAFSGFSGSELLITNSYALDSFGV